AFESAFLFASVGLRPRVTRNAAMRSKSRIQNHSKSHLSQLRTSNLNSFLEIKKYNLTTWE
ncbi:MAG: hypothetical protein AB8G77_19455, partial [Rhodothermales bacterium]